MTFLMKEMKEHKNVNFDWKLIGERVLHVSRPKLYDVIFLSCLKLCLKLDLQHFTFFTHTKEM